ncbi:MAG: hypothetical protein ABL893_16725 [Hyphomicrobium sp.]
MQTADLRSVEATATPSADMGSPVSVSVGWLLRRTALWMLLVAAGVAGACLLYTAASKAEAESLKRTPQLTVSQRV